MSKPALLVLIRGKTELLQGMDIVGKLDAVVNFGTNAGKSDREMATIDGKHRLGISFRPNCTGLRYVEWVFWEIAIGKNRSSASAGRFFR